MKRARPTTQADIAAVAQAQREAGDNAAHRIAQALGPAGLLDLADLLDTAGWRFPISLRAVIEVARLEAAPRP